MTGAPASFASRITRLPIAHDPARAADRLRRVPALGPKIDALLRGVAGASPYLGRSIEQEGAWLERALSQAPEAEIAALCAAARQAEGPDLAKTLRVLKRRASLLIALADLGGLWPLETVTGALTDFVEACGHAALIQALRPAVEQGKLPGFSVDDLDGGAGLFVLAMGKMGARELNYSSDIDLICLFDAERFAPDALFRARDGYIRAVRRFTQTLSQQTEAGYVFRTDLRLRPDAGSTPVAMSSQAAEQYYEAEGRTWERGAFIKARAALGDIAAGAQFLKALQPFIWRKHLDFATLHDVQDIRTRIKRHKGQGSASETVAGHDVKLGRGGIRDIEFFTQTRQLIAGGRDPSLRASGTVPALAALARRDWISHGTAERLGALYTELRHVEHRLQMIADAQTHRLPKTPEGFAQLACLMGTGDGAALERDLAALFDEVDALAAPFFSPSAPLRPAALPPDVADEAQKIVARWPSYPALRSERGRQIFERLKPALLAQFARAARPEEALASFDSFLSQLPAGVQLFSLFEANPALVDLLVDICAVSPALARYLSRHAGVLDAVLMGEFFAPWPGIEGLSLSLAQALDGLDFEAAMDRARRWQKEWHFRIGVHILRRLITPDEAAAQFSDLAEAVIAALWPVAQAETARRHGTVPGASGAVLAMGSLGARQMNAASDLDLIVIYEAPEGAISDGARPLEARGWYAKATKALIAALSAPTGEGVIYAVDLRLRPSGGSGPVATSLAAFESYQRDKAWTWEHLALTRARPVAGPSALRDAVEAVRRSEIARPRMADQILSDTQEMRARLAEASAGRAGGPFALKDGAGGLQDIELLAQALALLGGLSAREAGAQLAQACAQGLISEPEADRLRVAHGTFASVLQILRLLGISAPQGGSVRVDDLGAGARALLLHAAQASEMGGLTTKLDALRQEAAAIVAARAGAAREPI